ncbi:MAG TPA: PAS domain S-box protein [Spirochaetia bacterium]|nr:PAS domain S-box protein [Spirochaetia bacterium]
MPRTRRGAAEDADKPGGLTEEEIRYRSVFRHSAVSLWEEDIAELRAALDRLKAEGVEDIRSWLDAHPGFIAEAARMISVVDVNDATLALYEVEDPESVRGPLDRRLDVQDPVVRASLRENVLAIWENRRYSEMESGAVTRSGRRFDIEIRVYIPPADDPYPYMLVSVLDVSQRKKAEAALLDSEERYRTLVESLGEGIVVVDREMGITFANPAGEVILGAGTSALRGRTLRNFLRPEADPAERESIDQWARGRAGTAEVTIVRPDGQIRSVLMVATPRRDKTGRFTGSFCTMRDVTETRRTEAALRRSEEQLAQSQKMEAVGRLAGGIAHGFNNLMTVMRGYADLVEDSLPRTDPSRDDVREIKRAIDRAADLTAQLLAFSRKQVLEPRVINPNDIVRRMEKILPIIIGEDIELVTFLHPEAGNVRADPGQIEQVLMNLAANARDAMPRGGTLTLRTGNVSFPPTRDHPEIQPGSYVMLSVTDTGAGMSPETLSRVFEPFFTTKEIGKGTGLGLATVYGIITQSGGTITCASEPGRGTEFTIFLPLVAEEAASDSEPAREERAETGHGTILLVEDEAAVRMFARSVLSQNGYTVLEAGNGSEALASAAAVPGDIDLLLTDVVMPQMSGPELGRRLREKQPRLKILYMSGYSYDLVANHGILDPHADLIRKPFDAQILMKRVQEALAHEERESESVKG